MSKKNRRKMRKALATMLAALLLVVVSVGATVAYLTADDTVVNTFTVGDVEIKLNEKDTDNDNVTTDNETYKDEDGKDYIRDKANKYNLLPGLTYEKDPMVTVLKDSEDCYVRALVTLTKGQAIYDLPSSFTIESCFDIGNKWEYKSEKYAEDKSTVTYEFWYTDIVENSDTDTELQKLFTEITMPTDITNEQLATLDGMTITVVAHAIQADGFDGSAEKAWAAFDA